MDDNENPSGIPPVDVEVIVTPPPPEPVESAPVVVPVTVIDSGDSGTSDAVLDHTIDHAGRIAELERENEELRAAAVVSLDAAATAQATADAAVDIAANASAAVAEADAQAAPEDDHTPNHEHAWFRPRGRSDR